MLVPVHTSGQKPPLFFVHGIGGTMPLGPSFARVLGPGQPLYAVFANGMDGLKPPIDNMRCMVQAYLDEIREIRPQGPIRIAGLCEGSFAVLEIARGLLEEGREFGPVILADPPPYPGGFFRKQQTPDYRQPLIAGRSYQQMRTYLLNHAKRFPDAMPFKADDPKQLHAAVLAGFASLVAFTTHESTPFPGPAQLILSAIGAKAFFHPQSPWSALLPGSRLIHVLPWDHTELFWSGCEHVARSIKFMLEEAPPLETLAERPAEQVVA